MKALRRIVERWRGGRGRTRPPAEPLARLLDRCAMLRLPNPAGRTVCCLSGALWITVDGRPEDVVLGPGECHRFTWRARAIVSALEGAAVAVLDRDERCRGAWRTATVRAVDA